MNIFLSLLLLIVFTGCDKTSSSATSLDHSTTVFSDHAMTIPYRILIGARLNSSDTQLVGKIIQDTFKEGNEVYNKWNPTSELSRLNQMKGGEIAKISSELEKVLHLTEEIVEISGGRFDPTIEPLQELWKHYLEQGEIPPIEAIEVILPVIGWDKIHFGHGNFSKDYDRTSIDLGGIAKGYIVDLLVERLNKAGFPHVFVEWGGEIRASGQHPDHREWTIYISRLGDTDPEHAIAQLPLKNQSIATSGDYQQYWIIKNPVKDRPPTIYTHIIDPLTYTPLVAKPGSVASASVLAPGCWLADGLATAAMLFETADQAEAWAHRVQEKYPETFFWLITREADLETDLGDDSGKDK